MADICKIFIDSCSASWQKVIGTFSLVLLFFGAFSQEGSKIFVSDESFEPVSTGNIYIAVDNLNFFKNNEYKSNYVTGYTLTGAWIRPKLIYYPDANFRFEVGGQVLKYNGRDEYVSYPWFSAVYRPEKHFVFRMGNLNQDQNHGLPEPVLDSEHYLNGKPEAGIQVKFKSQPLETDMWIDWQQMIFKGDPFKERFVFGTVANIILAEKGSSRLSLPVTFNGMHEGGEIDSAPGLAHTNITGSEGIKFSNQLNNGFIKSWSIETSLLQSTYPEGQTALSSKKGSAIYLRSGINSAYGNLEAGFWQGKRFFTPLGMGLFQSAALDSPNAEEQVKLCTLSYLYDRKIFKESNFGFRFNFFYNTVTGKTSNYEALYLMINFSVLFKKSAD